MSGVYFMDKDTLRVPLPYQYRDKIKEVPSARWNTMNKYWTVPTTYSNMFMLREKIPHLKWDSKSTELLETEFKLAQAQFQRKLQLNEDEIDRFPPRWTDLSELQKIGTSWLAHGKSCLLADKMGSGKTVQTCTALEIIGAKSVLIVCPPSVAKVWEHHIIEWTNLIPYVIQGTANQRWKLIEKAITLDHTALIVNWQSLRSHARVAGYGGAKRTEAEKKVKVLNTHKFDVVVADEAHRAKDPKAKQTRALWTINADRRWALTGTPIANTTSDFWTLLKFISPLDWPSRMKFVNTYCDTAWNPYTKATTDIIGFKPSKRDEFDSLTGYMWLRRDQEDILGRKITKRRSKRYAYLTGKHRKLYERVSKGMLSQLENGSLRIPNALVEHSRLMQISMSMIDIDEHENEDGELSGQVYLKEPSPKVNVLVQLLADLGDIPVVVMSTSRQLVEIASKVLTRKKKKHALITGKIPSNIRDIRYHEFKIGEIDLLLTTIGVSSEGVDLSRARHLIMLQRPWSLIQSQQSEDRIRRWTQTSDLVDIIDIITADTVDEKIRTALNEKQGRLAELTYEEVKDLLT